MGGICWISTQLHNNVRKYKTEIFFVDCDNFSAEYWIVRLLDLVAFPHVLHETNSFLPIEVSDKEVYMRETPPTVKMDRSVEDASFFPNEVYYSPHPQWRVPFRLGQLKRL